MSPSSWSRVAKKTTAAKSQLVPLDEGRSKLILRGKDFLFSQCTIVSSVCLEPNSHLIRPMASKFVNANGDAWSNEALKATYPSFIGAYNFVNHVQDPEKSVGFIADAMLRRMVLDAESRTHIHYVDILVATHRDFEDLIKKISTSQIEFLSMGCDILRSTCSACGHTAIEEADACDHLLYQKGKYFIDPRGVKRITAELLGDEDPRSVTFIEASWLTEPPAFGGAVKRNLLPIPADTTVEIAIPTGAAMRDAVQRFIRT